MQERVRAVKGQKYSIEERNSDDMLFVMKTGQERSFKERYGTRMILFGKY